MKRSDEEDPVKRLENLRNLRLENLGLQQDVWADFATATPVASARGSGLDPEIDLAY